MTLTQIRSWAILTGMALISATWIACYPGDPCIPGETCLEDPCTLDDTCPEDPCTLDDTCIPEGPFDPKTHPGNYTYVHDGISIVPDFPALETLPAGLPAPWALAGREIRQETKVRPLFQNLSEAGLREIVRHLSTAFPNRYGQSPHGAAAARWIGDRFAEIGSIRSDVSVQLVTHPGLEQPSVVARIHGRGALAAQRIVLGAHIDSLNVVTGMGSDDALAPGADDNATGTATLLEVFRVLVESGYVPDRTLEFIGFGGEELGRLGSQYIAKIYARDGITVAGMINFDGTSYSPPERRIALVMDFASPELSTYVTRLVDTYLTTPWIYSACGYGCSDHVSWTLAGYASVFPFESEVELENPHIHSGADTLDHLDFAHGLEFVRLGIAFAIETTSEN